MNLDRTTTIFFIITLINVILSTFKSILTVRAKNKSTAALINATAYGFYAMVVKQMATVSTSTVVIATVLCNLIGVYFSMWTLDKFSKTNLWKISLVPTRQDILTTITTELEKQEIGYNQYPMITQYGETYALDIFSKTTNESKIVKEIIEKNGGVKYHIVELNKTL